MQWFKVYHGTWTDPKLAGIALACGVSRSVVIACWVAVLDNASQSQDRGAVSLSPDDLAAALGEPKEITEMVLSEFERRGLVKKHRVTNWDKHQAPMSGAERMRKTRQKRKASMPLQAGVTPVAVTPRHTASHNATSRHTALQGVTEGDDGDGLDKSREESDSDPTPTESDSGSASGDLRSMIFGPCVTWLIRQSERKPGGVRSMVGRWLKEYGDARVFDTIMMAKTADVVEPIAYIERALSKGPRKRDGPKPGSLAARDHYEQWSDSMRKTMAAGVRLSSMSSVDKRDIAKLVKGGYLDAETARERGCPEIYLTGKL